MKWTKTAKPGTKLRRRKNPAKAIFARGGHVPNPPEDCRSPIKTIRGEHDILWVDTFFCVNHCAPKFCEVAKEYFEKCSKQYKEALERQRQRDKKKEKEE